MNSLIKETIDSKNINAICYMAQEVLGDKGIYMNKINSYKYKHSDLTTDENKQLLRINNLNDDDLLIGGGIYRILGDIQTKECSWNKIKEIDIFLILDQINLIKEING